MCQAIKLPSLVPVVPWRGSRSHMADTAGILAPWIENHSTHVYAQGPDGRRDTEIRMSRPCRGGEGRCCLVLAPSNQKRPQSLHLPKLERVHVFESSVLRVVSLHQHPGHVLPTVPFGS